MHFATGTQFCVLAIVSMIGCDKAPASSGPNGPTGSIGGNAGTGGSTADVGNETTCGPANVEDGFIEVKPSDPGIRYVGRFDFSKADAPRLAFPAVTIETRFEGDAIDIRLQETAGGGTTTTPYY